MSAIGQPMPRADGRLKVTGAARYTADIAVPGATHAALVRSTIANGRTVSIDTSAAGRAPGVIAVLTHDNTPRMNPTPHPWNHLYPHGHSYLPLQDDAVHYHGQPIALVVAATQDQARYAGTLIRVRYEAGAPRVFSADTAKDAVVPPRFLWPVDSCVGDPDRAIADAPVRIERTYATADRNHNQLEPHVTTAVWDDGATLTLYDTTQFVFGTKRLVSIVLGVPPEKVNVVSRSLGGGFGGKAYVCPHTLLAAVAAKVVERPVTLELSRAQMYSMAGHQAASVQTVALGASEDGRLAGIRHESITPTAVFDDYIEYAALVSRHRGLPEVVGESDYAPVEESAGPKATFSFAAVFAEVRVDPDLGIVRLNRFTGAYDAGRIINPRTARSQAIGGIIWGAGQALLERSETDPWVARYVSRNLSGYVVPSNADIPPLDVVFVGDFDEDAGLLGAKGLGELTATSVAPAIANAVYHATGTRVVDLPITLEKLLQPMEGSPLPLDERAEARATIDSRLRTPRCFASSGAGN